MLEVASPGPCRPMAGTCRFSTASYRWTHILLDAGTKRLQMVDPYEGSSI